MRCDGSLELDYRAGSILHRRHLLAVGNDHEMVMPACMWVPDGAWWQRGKSHQLNVTAAFFAGGV